MLKLAPQATFWAKVAISVPGQDKPASIEAEFIHMGREALKAFFEGLEGQTDIDALGQIVTNWRGVDAAFSRDHLTALLDAYPTAALAFFEAFKREVMEAKVKN